MVGACSLLFNSVWHAQEQQLFECSPNSDDGSGKGGGRSRGLDLDRAAGSLEMSLQVIIIIVRNHRSDPVVTLLHALA